MPRGSSAPPVCSLQSRSYILPSLGSFFALFSSCYKISQSQLNDQFDRCRSRPRSDFRCALYWPHEHCRCPRSHARSSLACSVAEEHFAAYRRHRGRRSSRIRTFAYWPIHPFRRFRHRHRLLNPSPQDPQPKNRRYARCLSRRRLRLRPQRGPSIVRRPCALPRVPHP